MRSVVKFIRRKSVWIPIVAIFLTVWATQLLWPSSMVRPFTYWEGESISLKSQKNSSDLCHVKTAEVDVTIKSEPGDSKAVIKPADIDTQFDCNKFAQQAASYPLKKKIIPFSLFARNNAQSPNLRADEQDKFLVKADELAKRLTVEPRNAELKIDMGVVNLENDTQGVKYAPEVLAPQLLAVRWPQKEDHAVYGEKTYPKITKQILKTDADKIQKRLNDGFSLTINKKTHQVAAPELGLWLSVQTKGKDKPEVIYHKEAVDKYLKDNQKLLKKELAMKSIDSEGSSKSIISALEESKPTASLVEAPLNSSKSPIAASPDSITKFINELEAKGESIGIYVKKIGGGVQYGTNSDRTYTAASTYKLFVAYSMMRRIDAGQLAWSSPFNGTTLGQCFDKMIVQSENSCPEKFLSQYGFATVQQEARSIGAKQVWFAPGNIRVSAQSLGIFLEKLGSGTLASADSQSRLLDAMGRQVFRRGIPAGSSYQVADKVGFLNRLLHDAAIVSTSQGKYVVVIMSDGSSWSRIAELTRMIASTF